MIKSTFLIWFYNCQNFGWQSQSSYRHIKSSKSSLWLSRKIVSNFKCGILTTNIALSDRCNILFHSVFWFFPSKPTAALVVLHATTINFSYQTWNHYFNLGSEVISCIDPSCFIQLIVKILNKDVRCPSVNFLFFKRISHASINSAR